MEYNCNLCHFETKIKQAWNAHIKSMKHIMRSNGYDTPENEIFKCEHCHYATNNKGNFGTHKDTAKHRKNKDEKFD